MENTDKKKLKIIKILQILNTKPKNQHHNDCNETVFLSFYFLAPIILLK